MPRREKGEEAGTPVGQEATSEEISAKGVVLCVRKRFNWVPKAKKSLTAVKLGYFVSEPLNNPEEVMEVLKEAEMPALGQIDLDRAGDTVEVTMRRRHFKERDSKKLGRFEQLNRRVKTAEEFVELMRKQKYLNKQITTYETPEQAMDFIAKDSELPKGRGRK